VGVDGIEREIAAGRQFDHFRACAFQFAHQRGML
jgi:hypothetical protein